MDTGRRGDGSGDRRASAAGVTWWKVLYSFKRPFWISYGRVAYVKADTLRAAETRARTFVERVQPDAEILEILVVKSDWAARLRFWKRVRAAWQWKQNAAHGIPNDPKSL